MDLHMNGWRLTGDMIHLASFFVLFHKVFRARSCKGAVAQHALHSPERAQAPSGEAQTARGHAGLSLKTQELFALVFCMRYLDAIFVVFGYLRSNMCDLRKPGGQKRARYNARVTGGCFAGPPCGGLTAKHLEYMYCLRKESCCGSRR